MYNNIFLLDRPYNNFYFIFNLLLLLFAMIIFLLLLYIAICFVNTFIAQNNCESHICRHLLRGSFTALVTLSSLANLLKHPLYISDISPCTPESFLKKNSINIKYILNKTMEEQYPYIMCELRFQRCRSPHFAWIQW